MCGASGPDSSGAALPMPAGGTPSAMQLPASLQEPSEPSCLTAILLLMHFLFEYDSLECTTRSCRLVCRYEDMPRVLGRIVAMSPELNFDCMSV